VLAGELGHAEHELVVVAARASHYSAAAEVGARHRRSSDGQGAEVWDLGDLVVCRVETGAEHLYEHFILADWR